MTDLTTSVPEKIQSEETDFRAPVSESLIKKIGKDVNWILDMICPVGTIIASLLDETNFQAQVIAGKWILCDGSDISGSALGDILVAQWNGGVSPTSLSILPDVRGVFLRAHNAGRVDSFANPSSFPQIVGDTLPAMPINPGVVAVTNSSSDVDVQGALMTFFNGDLAPKYVNVNYYVRIN